PSDGRLRRTDPGVIGGGIRPMLTTSRTLLDRLRDRNDAQAWHLWVSVYEHSSSTLHRRVALLARALGLTWWSSGTVEQRRRRRAGSPRQASPVGRRPQEADVRAPGAGRAADGRGGQRAGEGDPGVIARPPGRPFVGRRGGGDGPRNPVEGAARTGR